MAITAADVNKLRQMTGAGMMDCKRLSLRQMVTLICYRYFKKKGQQVAAKRATALLLKEEHCKVNADKTFAAVVVIGCETTLLEK